MAGELILPLKLNMRSVDWTATGDVARGDLVELPGGLVGFALGEAKATETVAVGIEADLVTVPQPDTARAWKAGEQVNIDLEGKSVGAANITRARLGFVHHDTPATQSRVPVVWSPGVGHFFEELTEDTTPAMTITAPAGQEQRLDNGDQQWFTDIIKTNLKGIRPGVPVHVTYEGAITWAISKAVISEITISYLLWESVPSRLAIIEHSFNVTTRVNQTSTISLDNFAIHFTLKPGDLVSRGRAAQGAVTEVLASDFTNGIPVRVVIRIRAWKPNTPGTVNDNQTRLNSVSGHEMQMITVQRGDPIR